MLHTASRVTIVFLSAIALACVASGYLQPTPRDEGTAAHLFQLSVAAWIPCAIVMIGTAGSRGVRGVVAPGIVATILLAAAFVALFFLEHRG